MSACWASAVVAQHGWQPAWEKNPVPAEYWFFPPCLCWSLSSIPDLQPLLYTQRTISEHTLPHSQGQSSAQLSWDNTTHTHLVGQPSALVILSAVSPSVMVMLLLLMCPFWLEGLWAPPCLPLASP